MTSLKELKQASTSASISGPTGTNTASVTFGSPVLGGFLTDLTLLDVPTSDTIDWSPNAFDNVILDCTNTGRIRFDSSGTATIARGPQPSGTVSDFSKSSVAQQAWKEDSPGFVNLDWIGAIAVAPIPIAEVTLANGWEYLIVDQTGEGGSIWKIIKGEETSTPDVYNLRAEIHNSADTVVSISNAGGSNVQFTEDFPASYGNKPTGAGGITESSILTAYYNQAPWSIVLPTEPFEITVVKPGLGRLEVEYTPLGGANEYKVSPSGSSDNLTFNETEILPNSTVTWTYSFADDGIGSFGIADVDISNVNQTITVIPTGGGYSTASTGSGTFVSASFSGSTLDLIGTNLNMIGTPEALLSRLWLEGIAFDNATSVLEADLAPLHRMMRLEGNTSFFGFETAIFRYNSTLMTFDSTTAMAGMEEVLSFMRSIDLPAMPQMASNNATPSEFVSITQLPLLVSAVEIGGIVIEDVEKSLNDLTNNVLGDVAFGIPPEEPYPGSGSLKE